MDRNRAQQRKATRKTKRVVRKGFYSDEDDESSEEEVSITTPRGVIRSPGQSLASALRSRSPAGARGERRNVISVGDVDRTQESFGMDRNITGFGGVADATGAVDEDEDLDEDHRLLLRASLPLLKSRNSGVVLGVCSLHYYCGVASIKIRSALGKSLVRIYHDRREIQFVVLNSIRALVWECPSAFTPFLNDFFVKAMDPSFTRLVKLDILAALCLEPNAITAVLNELNTYIRHDDKAFVCASIRAVDKIVELARIVHYRQGEKTRNAIAAKDESNKIALNCLHGLMTLSEISDNEEVVGECVSAMQRIILLLQSNEDGRNISDPNHVQGMALQRLLLLVVRSITAASSTEEEKYEDELENDQVPDDESSLHKVIKLPTEKVPAALWILGEWMVSSSNSLSIFHVNKSEKKVVRTELLRLIATSFSEMDQYLKCQAVHLASKVLLSKCSPNDTSLCEFILSLGRIDVIHDVRDRSRCESMLIHMAKGIQFDAESLPAVPLNSKTVTIDDARSMLLKQRPAPSWLPIESEKDKETNALRFGTLSSMVSRKAGKAYLLLPPWAEVDSPKILRDPQMLDSPESKSKRSSPKTSKDEWAVNANTSAGFYDSDEGNSKSSDSSSSDSDSSKSSSSSSSSESDSDSSKPSGSSDDESTSSDEVGNNRISMATSPDVAPSASIAPMMGRRQIMPSAVVDEPLPVLGSRSEDESSSDDESSDGSSTSSEESSIHDENVKDRTAPASSLIDVTFTNKQAPGPNGENGNSHKSNSNVSSISLGLEGLVMAPLVIDKDIAASDDSIENESSAWHVLVRHDLSGGLEASIRFLKGSSRSREANLLGFDSKNSAVVCLQVKFENKRGDGHAIRRIHFIQKKFAKSGVLSTTRISIPQEIASLGSSKVSFAIIGLEFAQASDKDRTLLAKFDVKCDRGTTPIDLCPSLAETLQECKISRSDFDAASLKLHGIHQQAKASFNLPTANVQSSYDLIPKVILKGSNLSVVESWTDNHCKFAGKLPASGNQVLLDIQCNPSSGAGEINIFCDSAMALNPLLASIKSTITTE
jgi:AP-3 complex subunit beta